MRKYLKEYCVGCGLCQTMNKACLETDSKGFKHPVSGDESWLKKVCPASGCQQIRMDEKKIWGHSKEIYYGWSNNQTIRKRASTGGMLTEIAVYLLNNNIVDSVIHVEAQKEDPTKTRTVISNNPAEVIGRCGSRYSISSPLDIMDQLGKDKKYAFIGKPCDVVVLQNYLDIEPALSERIIITLSFFCAGVPSLDAQAQLMQALNCHDCKTLKYRGDGWPGYTVATDQEGNECKLEYESAWGKILGRDIMKMCRFCLDGVGESADISCGDAWYLKGNKPDFSEHEGRNVVFARTDKGNNILKKMADEGVITITTVTDSELALVQPYQYQRRATMGAKFLAMKLLMKATPKYSKRILKSYGKFTDFSSKKRHFLGTGKRALKGKI